MRILNIKISKTKSIKIFGDSVVICDDEAITQEKILHIIFVGKNSQTECKACKKESVTECPVKKGLMTKFDIMKDAFKVKLCPKVLRKASNNEKKV
jgi:hypothetical protein